MDDANKLSLETRDKVCELLTKSFVIDVDFQEVVKKVIEQQQNSSLKVTTIENMIIKPMNLLDNVNVLKSSIHNFNGYVNEFICVYEYNFLKNKDSNILTILNPDSSSKTDIIHIIKTESGRTIAKAGGDVKSGQPSYVLQQYERHLNTKYDVPFIDYSGCLTDNKHLLTTKQKEKLEKLIKEFPRKKPVQPLFSNQERIRLRTDIVNYLSSRKLPSEMKHGESYIPSNRIESVELLWGIVANPLSQEVTSWSEFEKISIKEKESKFEYNIESGQDRGFEKKDINEEVVENNESLPGNSDGNTQLRPKSSGLFKSIKHYGGKFFSGIFEHVIIPFTQGMLEENESRDNNEYDDYYDDDNDYLHQNEDSVYSNDVNRENEVANRQSPRPHHVRGHMRTLSDGRRIPIKSYSKGNQE